MRPAPPSALSHTHPLSHSLARSLARSRSLSQWVLDPIALLVAPYLRIIHFFLLNLSSLYRANTLIVLILKVLLVMPLIPMTVAGCLALLEIDQAGRRVRACVHVCTCARLCVCVCARLRRCGRGSNSAVFVNVCGS